MQHLLMQCKRRNKPTAKGDGIKKTSEKEEQKVKAHYLSSRFKNKILKPTDKMVKEAYL